MTDMGVPLDVWAAEFEHFDASYGVGYYSDAAVAQSACEQTGEVADVGWVARDETGDVFYGLPSGTWGAPGGRYFVYRIYLKHTV